MIFEICSKKNVLFVYVKDDEWWMVASFKYEVR